ncbi:MAG: hypothetical protein Q4D13_07080 [Erysipelotrichaceae bacterium]|nr:hypothetical protein [Erysipelotrichaceae bacterium]
MYRRGGWGFFPFIFIFFAFGIVGDILGGAFNILFALMQLAIPALVIYFIYSAIKSANNESTSQNTYSSRRSSRVRRKDTTTTVTNNNQKKIDAALSDYFAKNDKMLITDNIYFANKNNQFVSYDKMQVFYYDEEICTLKELSSAYPDLYTEIMVLLNKFAKKGYEPQKETKKDSKEKQATKPKQTVKPKSKADTFIDQIQNLNDNIENVDITNGLNQTCDLLKRIELVDKEDGKEDEKLNKLYEYYLPILTGILDDYKRLSSSPIKGEDFKKCETQLIKTLNLINQALVTIAESLHDNDYMNLNADMSTLESLLKKDGYTESPFKENKNG